MKHDSRIPEIKENLKQDSEDLLRESARLVTGFFKHGLCSVRTAADRWKTFAKEIAGAAESLFTPAFIRGAETPEAVLDPEAQPLVMITNSKCKELRAGQRMTLSQANDLIGKLDAERGCAGEPSQPVTLKIDYMLEGQTDRYWVNLDLGDGGGNLLEHIKSQMEQCRQDSAIAAQLFKQVAPEFRDRLGRKLIPGILQEAEKISKQLMRFFQEHCKISTLKHNLAMEARTLPENVRQEYLKTARETLIRMRRRSNEPLPAGTFRIVLKDQKQPPSVRENLKQYRKKATVQGRGKPPQIQAR